MDTDEILSFVLSGEIRHVCNVPRERYAITPDKIWRNHRDKQLAKVLTWQVTAEPNELEDICLV